MRTVSKELINEIKNENLTLVKCYKIILNNKNNLYFTDFSENLIIENSIYISNNIFKNKNLKESLESLDTLNNTIYGYIDNEIFNEDDINAGVYNNAKIEIFLVNYNNLKSGKIILFTGFIKSISIKNNIFYAEIENILSLLNKNITENYSPLCRCKFCSEKCGLNEENYYENGVINEIINDTEFITHSTNIISKQARYYNNGIIKILSGKNINQITEIKSFSAGNFILKFKLPFQLEINTNFKALAGCDKTFSTCYNVFNNVINFRGEPNLPRNEKFLKFY